MAGAREKLINHSLEELRIRGYNAVGVQQIADAAGMPKGSFYNHFESKEDFAVAATEAYLAEGVLATTKILGDKTKTPLRRLIELYAGRTVFEKKRLRGSPGCLLNTLAQEMAGASPVIRKTVSQAIQTLIDIVADCIGEAAFKSEIHPPLPVNDLAAFIETSWRGALLMARANHSIHALQNFNKMLPLMLGKVD